MSIMIDITEMGDQYLHIYVGDYHIEHIDNRRYLVYPKAPDPGMIRVQNKICVGHKTATGKFLSSETLVEMARLRAKAKEEKKKIKLRIRSNR